MRNGPWLSGWRGVLAKWRRGRRRSSVPTAREHPYRDTEATRARPSSPTPIDSADLLLLAPVLYWVALAFVAQPESPAMLWVIGAGAPLLVLLLSALCERPRSDIATRSSFPPSESAPGDSEELR